MSWHQIWAHFSNFAAKKLTIFKLLFWLSWAVQLSQNICSFSCHYKGNNCKFYEIPGQLRFIGNVAYNYRTLEWMNDWQPIRFQEFYNLRRANDADWLSRAAKFKKWAHIWCQLITKSDLIAGINFRNKIILVYYIKCSLVVDNHMFIRG